MDISFDLDCLSEKDILHRLRSDDKQAFEILYTRYWAELYQTAFNVLKNRPQSMDVVQEIFIWIWEHRQTLLIKTSLKGYLHAAVKFKTANFIRNGKIRESFFRQIEAMHLAPERSAETDLEVKELENIIRQTIDSLPSKCKTIYQMSRNDNLSNKKIADELAISVKTVENQMTIALSRIRMAVMHMLTFFILFLNF